MEATIDRRIESQKNMLLARLACLWEKFISEKSENYPWLMSLGFQARLLRSDHAKTDFMIRNHRKKCSGSTRLFSALIAFAFLGLGGTYSNGIWSMTTVQTKGKPSDSRSAEKMEATVVSIPPSVLEERLAKKKNAHVIRVDLTPPARPAESLTADEVSMWRLTERKYGAKLRIGTFGSLRHLLLPDSARSEVESGRLIGWLSQTGIGNTHKYENRLLRVGELYYIISQGGIDGMDRQVYGPMNKHANAVTIRDRPQIFLYTDRFPLPKEPPCPAALRRRVTRGVAGRPVNQRQMPDERQMSLV